MSMRTKTILAIVATAVLAMLSYELFFDEMSVCVTPGVEGVPCERESVSVFEGLTR